jgi:ABC-type nitrate/sulfonate/bicarbonate transport system ATPase subunit
VDVTHLAANELRSLLGVVPQETVLFSGTILDNLKLANPYASFEQIVAACKMAEIHAAIETLPAGYQTVIGERGVGLSGGQRQRLSIARALLKGPKVLIFDESTSSVDPMTAEQLARTINALKGRVTILFIAHLVPKCLQIDHTVRIGEKLSVVPNDRPEPSPQPSPTPRERGPDQPAPLRKDPTSPAIKIVGEQLCLASSGGVEIFVPRGAVSDHRIDDRQQLAHTRRERHFLGLTRLEQPLV